MSRTTRRSYMDHWSTKRRADYVEDSLRYTGIARDRAFNNYDKRWGSDCGEAFTGAPKGYCGWSTVGLGSKSHAKRGAAKVMRNRAKAEIHNEVRSLQGDADL